MTSWEPSNSVVRRLVAAIDDGDRDVPRRAPPDATLTDDGNPRSLYDWIDREIFSAHGHMNVEHENDDGLHLLARYRKRHLGEMPTFWRFQVTETMATPCWSSSPPSALASAPYLCAYRRRGGPGGGRSAAV